MAGIGAFGAVALGVLYVTITMEQRRRKKRGADELQSSASSVEELGNMIQDVLATGSILPFFDVSVHRAA